MTSPAHTPVQFLDGGAAQMFSARCLDALAKAGLCPEDFGSYDYVDKEIEKAKKRVNLENDMKYGCPPDASPERRKAYDDCRALRDDIQSGGPPAGADQDRAERYEAHQRLKANLRTGLPPDASEADRAAVAAQRGQPAPRPRVPPLASNRERRLSGSQSGHLVMNSSYQRDRGNPCSSMVDGYEDNLAPCMPHDDSTAVAGRGHHWVYHYEVAQPAARGLEQEGGSFKGVTDPATGQAPPTGTSRYPADQIARDEDWRIRNAPFIDDGDPPTTPEDRPAAGSVGGGSTATTTAPDAMAGSGAGSTAAASTDGETPLWQQEIDGETAAECIVAFKNAAMAAMKQKCKDDVAKNELLATGGNSGLTPAQYQQQLRDEIADPATSAKRRKAAERELNRAQRAHCRATAGRRIGTSAQQNDARCPAGNRATTHERSHGDTTPINLIQEDQYPDPPVT